MKKILTVIALALFSAAASYGQATLYQSDVRSTPGPVVPGALVTICASTASLLVTPCAPKATIWQNTAMTLPQNNPVTADGSGNYSFYAIPGTYVISVTGRGLPGRTYTIMVLCGPNSTVAGCAAGSNILPTPNTWTASNNFLGGLSVFNIPVAGFGGLWNIGDCPLVATISPLTFSDSEGTCSGGGGSGTVVPSPQYSLFAQPNSGSSATAQGVNITTDSTGNNLSIPGTLGLTGHVITPLTLDDNGAAGNAALKSFSGDGTCYASSFGNDSNDGRSKGNAKLTIYGCLISLPGGSSSGPLAGQGTVYFESGTSANPTTGCGLWLMGPTDPNYSSPPTCWVKAPGGSSGRNFVGIPRGNFGTGPTSPKAQLGGGSSADINHPCIWISGVNTQMRFENIQCNFQGRPIVVGEDSNHGRTGASAGGSSGITFFNVGAAPNTISGQGPAWDIVGGSFWLNFFFCFGQGTDQVNTPTNNDAAAFLFDGTGNDGIGEIYLDHISLAGGGIKVIPGTVNPSVQMFQADHIEAESLHAPAAVWFTGPMGAAGVHDVAANDSIGTSCNGGVCAVRYDGPVADSLSVGGALLGSGIPPIQGPMIETGGIFDLVGQPGIASSFLRDGLAGVIGRRLIGTSDVSRRQFGPTFVRFANAALSPAGYVVIPGTTLTQNVADPSGGTGATRLTATGPGEGVYVASQSGITVNVGDWFVLGAWVHSFTSNGYATSGNPLSIGITGCTITYSSYPGFIPTPMPLYGGDGEWEWISTAVQVATVSGGTCQPNINISADSTHTLDLYGPVYFHVPVANTLSANEMLEIANNLQSYSNSCTVGQECLATGPVAVGGTVTHTPGSLISGQYSAGNGGGDVGTYPSVVFPVVLLAPLTSHNAQSANSASISSAGSTVTCGNCTFVSGDAGKAITLGINGVGPSSGGGVLVTTIATFVSTHVVTTAATAGTSNLTGLNVLWGTPDSTAINSAISTISANGGGELQVACGAYYIDAMIQSYPNVNIKALGKAGESVSAQDCVSFLVAGNVTTGLQVGIGSSVQFQTPRISDIAMVDLFSQATQGFYVNGAANGTLDGTVAQGFNGNGAAGYRFVLNSGQASTWALNDARGYDCTTCLDASTVNVDGPIIKGGEFIVKNSNTNFTGVPIGVIGSTIRMSGTHIVVGQNAGATQDAVGIEVVNAGGGGNYQAKIEAQTTGHGIGIWFEGASTRNMAMVSVSGLAIGAKFDSSTSNEFLIITDAGGNTTQLVSDAGTNNSVYTQPFWEGPRTVFASLPATANIPNNAMILVTDCATSACVAGGGSIREIFANEAGTWTPISGSGGGGGSPGGATDATQYNAGGGTFGGVPSPVVNGVYGYTENIVASAAVVPSWNLPGVPTDVQSSSTPAFVAADRASLMVTSNSTTSTATALPQAGSTGFTVHYPTVTCNTGSVVNTITPITSTINGNATIKLVGEVTNPECAFIWSDNTNYRAALILPTDANGRLQAAGMGTLTGDVTGTAGTYGTVVTGINGTAFSGVNGDVVAFGASNIPADSGILVANLTYQTAAGAANELCTYTGSNNQCVPGVATNAMLQNYSTTVNGEECDLGGTCSITAGVGFPATVTGTTTSGGIPYFSDTVTLTSSGLLCTQCLVLGGGSGGSPATGNGDFTYATHTLAGGSSGIFDMHAAATSGVLLSGSFSTGFLKVTTSTGALTSVASTGSGSVVLATSPTLVTPTLGVAAATTINKVTLTAPATGSTLTIADGKTLAASNSLTLAGTDSTTMTFPSTSATIARTDAANTFTGHQTIEGVTSTGATGTGNFVFATSPTLTTPVIGAATGTSLIATGIVDGLSPVTITTGSSATLGAGTYQSGYTANQEATAGTGVTYTLPATVKGMQFCVYNDIVSGTGAPDTGVLTVYPPASSYIVLNGVINTIGGGGTHGVASGGAAADSACFLATDSTHWKVWVIKGTWTAN